MKYAIYDACFSEMRQRGRGVSALYLAWELSRRGISEYAIADADCILATCQAPEAALAIKTIRMRYPRKTIICGGSASTSPYSLGLYSDAVCVGDGQAFLATLFDNGLDAALSLSNVWIDGQSRKVEVDSGFPWYMPPIQAEDGAYRLWCGRGCKNRCLFCQTGWAYEYSENPNPNALIRQARQIVARGERIAYLSNDPMQHSFWGRLPAVDHGSYSVRFLRRHGLPPARQVRLGVEGVSERLRQSVAKPIPTDDLVQCTRWLNDNGKSVRWFMIAGLPGEGWDDWLELMDSIQRWKRETTKGVLAVSFTAFLPEPATPLSIVAIDDNYWVHWERFKEWFFGGQGWSNRVKLMNPKGPGPRMTVAALKMGIPEEALRAGGCRSPNERVAYPHAEAAERIRTRLLTGREPVLLERLSSLSEGAGG